jgi:hypothetical protein
VERELELATSGEVWGPANTRIPEWGGSLPGAGARQLPACTLSLSSFHRGPWGPVFQWSSRMVNSLQGVGLGVCVDIPGILYFLQ